jgi:hypothetical protein
MTTHPTDRLLKVYGDHYESHSKIANYLFVSHGAGLVGCLALLKDYGSTPSYKGVGMFIILFGCGLLAAIGYYASLGFTRATVINSILDEEEPNDSWRKFLTIANSVSLVISVLLFIIAIIALMAKFATL